MAGRPKLTDAEKIAAEKEKLKDWRKNTVKYYDSTSKISDIERAVLANDKYDDVTVWAMQAFCIDPNPVLFYKATHAVKEDEIIANIIKRADTFVNNPTMVSAIRAMKKDIAGKSYVPASIRRRVMLEKEVEEMEKMVENNIQFDDVDREEAIKAFTRRVRLNPDDTEAWNWLTTVKGWKKLEDINAVNPYDELCKYFVPYDCSLCERRNTSLCSGCSFEKQDKGELTEEEIKYANELSANA